MSDDINIFDFNEVMWAYSTRCRPSVNDYYFEDCLASPLVPYQSQGVGSLDRGTKIVRNCLLPVEYTTGPNWETADFEHAYLEEVKRKVRENWKKIGVLG